jgi:branched-subunit amino acid ABC-type transport system permease component
MTEYLTFALLGLGSGALYAALASGLLLAYRGSGVVNLSHGAMAMYVAYTYAGLRAGKLMLPLWQWPAFVKVSGGMGAAPAFVLSLVIAALLGLVLHLLVFRPLREAPPLAKTVASVGVLLVLQSTVVLRFGTQNINLSPIWPQGVVHIGGADIPQDRLYMLGLAVVLAVLLSVALRTTKTGRSIRAASENEQGAILIGLSPSRLAAITWVSSSVLAGAVGILYASIAGLNPVDQVLFVIPALGAVLLANFESFGVATVAAVLIGCVESITIAVQTQYTWFPQVGAAQLIPFLVIALTMVLRGRSLPSRGALVRVRLPASPEPGRVWPLFTASVVVAALAVIFLPFDLREGILNSMVLSVVALSLVVITGFAGQISLLQMSIAGLTALLMARFADLINIGFPFDGILAVIAAAVAGVLAGLPAIRVRGVQLAVLTLGAAYAFESMILDNPAYTTTRDQTYGTIHEPGLFGLHFGVNRHLPFGSRRPPNAGFEIMVLIVLVLCCAFVIALRRSDLGRRFLAVRSDERAAAGLGINVARTKLIAFSIAAMLAGVAGALGGWQFQSISPSQYTALACVQVLAIAYLGGISSVGGAIAAGTLAAGGIGFALIDRAVDLGQYQPLLAGLGLIVTAIFNPEGIAGVTAGTWHAAGAWLNKRRRSSGSVGNAGEKDQRPAQVTARSGVS